MMIVCATCGIGDDLDNMFHATIEVMGRKDTILICEDCAKSGSFKDIFPVIKTKEALGNK